MLMVIAFFAGLEGLMYLLDIPFKKKIQNATTVEESLAARRKMKFFRRFWSLLLIILLCAGVIALYISIGDVDPQDLARDLGLIISFAIISGWRRLRGNVQSYSKDGYLEKHGEGYVLYLRAFESDDYETGTRLSFSRQDPSDLTFEGILSKVVKRMSGMKMCAIGMTREVDAPYGADRVYVDDQTWQSDVKELMERSAAIIILMSDRESCIWEIEQSAAMIKKSCYLIKSKFEYERIRNSAHTVVPFPAFEDIISKLDEQQAEDFDNENIIIGLMMDDGKFKVETTQDLNSLVAEAISAS